MSTDYSSLRERALLWSFCQVLFITIPLFVYALFFVLVTPEKGWEGLACKPEWMFIALMYYAESLRDSIELQNNSVSIKTGLRDIDVILSVLLLVVSSLVLFAILGRYEGIFPGFCNLTVFQWVLVGFGFVSCWYVKYALKYNLICEENPDLNG